jgi:aldehyde dehydrogenase (NAD+)
MYDFRKFYIDGQWIDPIDPRELDVIDPASEEAIGKISLGSEADVDLAATAARRAFDGFAQRSLDQRRDLLRRILEVYEEHQDEIAAAISDEMGAPKIFARKAQAATGSSNLKATIAALDGFEFAHDRGTMRVVREPIGVCGLITPWNWPINQIVCKVAPAIATGCTMVLKPSEIAPLSGYLFARVLDEAGVPPGVFNLVNGDGPTVGQAICSHPEVDFVSFTGSTRAGVLVARAAAPTVKRVAQELGGKSANIILDDADVPRAVTKGAFQCFSNSGQSCDAPTRMLVPADRHDEAAEIAAAAAAKSVVGHPKADGTRLGPVVSQVQFDKIQGLIAKGIDEGAILVTGGPGRPEGLDKGYYVRPTVFAGVSNGMTIAREEIFGPVLSILPYKDEAEAIAIANDTPYGLSAYVSSGDPERSRRVAMQLRTGQVHIDGAPHDDSAPFGGYKQSGNGRECGSWGLEEYLETKALLGYNQK